MVGYDQTEATVEELLEQQHESIEELLEQQHQSIAELKSSFDSFNSFFDEMDNKMDLMMDMLRGLSNDIRKLKSPSDYGSELSTMDLQPDDTIGDVAVCDERSEPNVQKVEAFISTTPITGISAASTYTTRFEETTDDIAVDGRKNVTESDVCSEVCNVFDELTESSSAVLLKGPVNKPCARYLFDELPRPFLVEQNDRIAGNVDNGGRTFPFVDLQSVLCFVCETTINGSSNGSTRAWFVEATSGLKVVLSQNAIDDVAHKVFDEITGLVSTIGIDECFISKVGYQLIHEEGKPHLLMMRSVKVEHHLFEKGLEPSSVKHINGIMLFIFDPGGRSDHLEAWNWNWNWNDLFYPKWGENFEKKQGWNMMTMGGVYDIELELVVSIHASVIKDAIFQKDEVSIVLLSASSKHGLFEHACPLFILRNSKKMISWNTLINGYQLSGLLMRFPKFKRLGQGWWDSNIRAYCMHGECNEAVKCVGLMQHSGVKPHCSGSGK